MHLPHRSAFIVGILLFSLIFEIGPAAGQGWTEEYFDHNGHASSQKTSFYFSKGRKNKRGFFYDSLRTYYTTTKKLRSVEIRDPFGNPIGYYVSFYPNGVLKLKGRYEKKLFKLFQSSPDSTEFAIEQFNDSLGNTQVKNWNGIINGRLEHFLEKGKIVNGLRDDVWTSYYNNGKIFCQESWHEGELVDGISYDPAGKEYYYNAMFVPPEPAEGDNKFYDQLSDAMEYPKEAQRRGIEGKIIVQFIVEKNGAITDPHVLKGLGFGCNEEAIRVVSLSKPWKPALQKGQPVAYTMTIPFIFKLK